MATVNGDRLAEALNISVRRIQWLVQNEGLPQIERGRYDLGQCYYWYVRYLQRAIQRRQNIREHPTKLQINQERLLDAQVSLEELDLQERRALMIPVEVHERLVLAWAITIRQRVMALPSRLADLLVGLERRPIYEVIDREVREVLRLLGTGNNGNGNSHVISGTAGDNSEQ
jgi:phage terminase Nu1 subunit (DNA packaging protein)